MRSEDAAIDAGFQPACAWIDAYEREVDAAGDRAQALVITIVDPAGHGTSQGCRILPPDGREADDRTFRRVERIVKTLLWQHGGCDFWLSDRRDLVKRLRHAYEQHGERAFDAAFFSERVYHRPLCFHEGEAPALARHCPVRSMRDGVAAGCRIGYDLGGTDRKCAAVMDGEVVYSEEIAWDPYHQKDPDYHLAGVRDCLRRAAAHLPRVDAIGGSSAGVIIDHVPHVASLFRGLSETQMEAVIRPFFRNLSKEWGGIPVSLLNDGDIAALAGAQWLGVNGVLGIALGTSLAAGYVDPEGRVGGQLNELAFCPVDFNATAPVDEWSGDTGCGVQYFSQQAVFRLADELGMTLPDGVDAAARLQHVQHLAQSGESRAVQVFEQIGTYLGETIPYWKQFYDFDHLVLMGRVVSGSAGAHLLDRANAVLGAHQAEKATPVTIHVPDETFRRHGQAIVAATVPQLHAIPK